MGTRTLRRNAAVVLACGLIGAAAVGQPPPAELLPPPPAVAVEVTPAPPPKPPGVDQLIDRLAELRAQKSEIEGQEQAVVKVLRERLRHQTDRLAKLGVTVEPETIPPPAIRR